MPVSFLKLNRKEISQTCENHKRAKLVIVNAELLTEKSKIVALLLHVRLLLVFR